MEPLTVNPAKLAAAAKAITGASSDIDEILEALEAEANGLRAQWTGDAQLAFDAALGGFHTGMSERAALAAAISDALTTLADVYSDTDLDGARRLGPS